MIRVLVVDDAVVVRRMISGVLNEDSDLEVVGVAANGRIALNKLPQVNPDVVTLDIEMPEMDGLETLRGIRETYPDLPVIMFSTLSKRGAVATLDALALGASDYATKPSNVGGFSEGMAAIRNELIPKIKALCPSGVRSSGGESRALTSKLEASEIRTPFRQSRIPFDVLTIGSSTGGPNALADVFSGIKRPLNVPTLVVQHMPAVFTQMLAERLDRCCPFIQFFEAAEGQEILPNCGYIAPGGKHLELVSENDSLRAHLHEGPPENSCRPAVDVLFRSVVKHFGSATLAVVLTGMGQDGLRGCEKVVEKDGFVLTQDQASSVVWGMPGSVVKAGLAHRVLPIERIAEDIQRRLARGRLGQTKGLVPA